MSKVFGDLWVPCCQPDAEEGCVCGSDERILRAYADRLPSLPPMTKEQRNWCLDEIGGVEGYNRFEYEEYPDHDLAYVVLRAWVDYCRDNGML